MKKRTLYKRYTCGLALFFLVLVALCIGEDPCSKITCPTVCRGDDLWEQKCIGGECVDSRMIEKESPECYTDPCENVFCEDGCFGTDLWKMKCLEGECIPDYIIEKDSEQCGAPKTPPKTEPPQTDTDHDGVFDENDKCHNPGCTIVDTEGCPKDSDNDGFDDCNDNCPYKAGVKAYNGCPKPGIIGWEGDIPIIDWRYADQFYGEYVIIEGTIVDTYNSGKACFLNFHPDWQQYFTVVIFACDFPNFPELPEVYYLGKKVQVIGIIKEYKGKPEIIVKTPDQIRVVG